MWYLIITININVSNSHFKRHRGSFRLGLKIPFPIISLKSNNKLKIDQSSANRGIDRTTHGI